MIRVPATLARACLFLVLVGAGRPLVLGQAAPGTDVDTGIPAAPAPEPPRRADVGERLLHNPRERTRQAIRDLKQERSREAVAAATLAHRLDPSLPTGSFNQGTVSLLTGDAAAAVAPLIQAAEGTDTELATDAAYNLAGAYHQQRLLDEAIDWYRQALRQDPDHLDAKINLELALREQQQQQNSQGSDQDESPDQDQQQSDAESGEEQQQPDSGGQQQPQEGEEESPLPRFQPRPDMTAEEAASLLDAVEAMEREARAELQPENRRAAPGNRDW